jgi:hypothetical protein
VERFLYKDTKTQYWIIASKVMRGIHQGAGNAFNEDVQSDRVRNISQAWHVWHAASKSFRTFADNDETTVKRPIDKIVAASVVGFEIMGEPEAVSGLMLRNTNELYGRPVYESEGSGLFLYWMKRGGSIDDGIMETTDGACEMQDASKLFESAGHWVIAQKLGETEGGPACVAYIQDPAVTPDQISTSSCWMVRGEMRNGKAGRQQFRKSSTLKLRLEEWARDSSALLRGTGSGDSLV